MAFKASELSVLAYANNFTLWHYRVDEEDGMEFNLYKDYFNPASDMLRLNDAMYIECGHRTWQVFVSEHENGSIAIKDMFPVAPPDDNIAKAA